MNPLQARVSPGPLQPNDPMNYPKSFSKQAWQYGLSFCSLNVPLLSWQRQKEQVKCSGWYLRNMAVMQRPKEEMNRLLKIMWKIRDIAFYQCSVRSGFIYNGRTQDKKWRYSWDKFLLCQALGAVGLGVALWLIGG